MSTNNSTSTPRYRRQRKVGNPQQVRPLSRSQRAAIISAAGLTWRPDICRHTFISNRLQIVKNDGQVAREGGTSEEVIYRHYHELVEPADARKWAALRPPKAATKES